MKVRLNPREWRPVPIVAGLKTIVFAPGELVEISPDDEKYVTPFILTGLLAVAEDDAPKVRVHPRFPNGLTTDKILSVQPMDAPVDHAFGVETVQSDPEAPPVDGCMGETACEPESAVVQVEEPGVAVQSDDSSADGSTKEEPAPKSIPRKKAK